MRHCELRIARPRVKIAGASVPHARQVAAFVGAPSVRGSERHCCSPFGAVGVQVRAGAEVVTRHANLDGTRGDRLRSAVAAGDCAPTTAAHRLPRAAVNDA
jgi:hypothetical protein